MATAEAVNSACYTRRDFAKLVFGDYLKITRQLIVTTFLLIPFSTGGQTNQTTTSSTTNNQSPGVQSTPDQFAAVRGIYGKECESCHGKTGQGGTVKQEDGTKLKVPSLREGHALR